MNECKRKRALFAQIDVEMKFRFVKMLPKKGNRNQKFCEIVKTNSFDCWYEERSSEQSITSLIQCVNVCFSVSIKKNIRMLRCITAHVLMKSSLCHCLTSNTKSIFGLFLSLVFFLSFDFVCLFFCLFSFAACLTPSSLIVISMKAPVTLSNTIGKTFYPSVWYNIKHGVPLRTSVDLGMTWKKTGTHHNDTNTHTHTHRKH